MKLRFCIFLLSLLSISVARTSYADQTLYITTHLRAAATASVKVQVLTNPHASQQGQTILIHHGLVHTGNAALPLAQALLADPVLSNRISNIVLFDLPGHGGSSNPEGMRFGEMSLDDYANNFLSLLTELNAQGVHVDSVVAHSMGATVVQLAQSKLVAQARDLKQDYGVQKIIFLASSMPRQLPWFLSDSGLTTVLAAPNLRYTQDLGTYIDIPTLLWQNLWFTTRLFVIYAPGTPSLWDIDRLGYNSKEPYQAAAELVGVLGYQRANISAGIFSGAQGPRVRVVAFSEDRNVATNEEQNLYRYLTNDMTDQRFTIVPRFDAVHDMLVSAPQALITAGVFVDLQ